jgi:hypothetical protein
MYMELIFKADFIVKLGEEIGNLPLKELQETLIHVRAADHRCWASN